MSELKCTSFDNVQNTKGVDVSKLQVGMVVKNYRELCKLLGEEIKEGNSKEKQLHRWSLNFCWEKQPSKQKITITKIYKHTLPDIVPDNSTFAKIMQLILMRILGYYTKDDTYHFFANKFWVDTGMVDKQFKEINTDEEGIDKYFGADGKFELVNIDTARSFFEIANAKLREATKTALKALDNAGLIHYRQEYCVKRTPWKIKGGFESATKEEENLILEAEQYALGQLRIANKYFALKNSGNFYRKTINDYINERNPKIYGASQWITIVYHKPPKSFEDLVINQIIRSLKKNNYIQDEEYLDNDILLYLSKLALNDMVINKMIEEARRQHKKALEELNKEVSNNVLIDRYNHHHYVLCGSNRFVSDCIYLADTLVKLKDNNRILDYEENNEDETYGLFELGSDKDEMDCKID